MIENFKLMIELQIYVLIYSPLSIFGTLIYYRFNEDISRQNRPLVFGNVPPQETYWFNSPKENKQREVFHFAEALLVACGTQN